MLASRQPEQSPRPRSTDFNMPAPIPETSQRIHSALPHWLRLANLPLSAKVITSLIQCFDYVPEAIFGASEDELSAVPLLSRRHIATLRQSEFIATDRQIKWFEQHGVQLLLPGDEEFSPALETIPDPPPFLFVLGSLANTS